MRGLFRWALEREHVAIDPTAGVKAPRPRTEGFHAWTEAEISQYEARWPLGTRERLAFGVLLYTGLRRGDAVRAGPAMVTGGLLTIKTEKTGRELVLPILAPLRQSLEAGPVGRETWIAGERGGPLTKESFGTWFKSACKGAGLAHCSAHGLRKAGATRAANGGATVAQLEAIFGWDGGGMASLYTKKADRERLAREAMSKLERG
jgi:integrase